MNIYAVQHVPFEGLGCIAEWVENHGSTTTMIRMYAQDPFPAISAIDLLVVLGGPMSTYQEREYPWLVAEKRFIREVIDAGKTVLGICLGAQLIADVLGAKVSPNSYKEIGWFTIDFTDEARACPLLHFEQMPQTMTVFHWHGDTFDVPKGALLLASSAACRNQGFVYDGGRVIAFQFHIEMKHENIVELINHCGHEIDTNLPYVTSASAMLAHSDDVAHVNAVMLNLLHRLQTNQPTKTLSENEEKHDHHPNAFHTQLSIHDEDLHPSEDHSSMDGARCFSAPMEQLNGMNERLSADERG